MSVNDLSFDPGPSIYYDNAFRHVLEDHMNLLSRQTSTTVLALDPSKVYKFEHDLFGYLASIGLAAHLHWVVMRLNRMSSPNEFTIENTQLLIPDAGVLERIRQSHMSSRKIA